MIRETIIHSGVEMRFFIALEIQQEKRKQLQLVQTKLKQLIPQVRLTDNSKLHLTITFVGEQPNQLKDSLINMIKKAVVGIPIFNVTPAYIDAFPKLHNPRTFWIGVKGDIDKLVLIRERVKDGLINLNLAVDERRYTPHIAIAKINNGFKLKKEQENRLEQIMATHLEPIQISSIKLFESIPQHGFHKHNTLAEVKLI